MTEIKAINNLQEEKIRQIRTEIFLKQNNAEIELNIAKKLKNKVDDSFEPNGLLKKEIQMIENEKSPNTAIGKLKEAEQQLQQDDKDILFENIYILLNDSLKNYKKSITNIKKYKALVYREIIKKEIIEIERIKDKTNDFFYDKKTAINLKKEIENEMTNINQKETAANLFDKAKLILDEAENIYFINNNIDNNENINNKYDSATFYFQESLEKYQQIKIKLKKFFIEIFKDDQKIEEKQPNNNKIINSSNEITNLSNEQDKLKKWQIIIFAFNLIIYILFFIFFKNKNQNNFWQKIKNKEFILKKSL